MSYRFIDLFAGIGGFRMGFHDDFKLVGTYAKLYNRIGNSIVVPMVEEIAAQVKLQFFNGE